MSVNLLTEHHLEFLRLKGGCTGPSKSTLVKMPYCWKSRVTAQMSKTIIFSVEKVVCSDFELSAKSLLTLE